jgi:hypothetical protein
MHIPETDHGASLRSYPNLSEAAKILEVSTSTLSRREDLKPRQRGERDQVLSAGEVLRLAAIYRRRALNDVAQDLLDRAAEASDEERRSMEEEVERFFEERELRTEDLESFVETARRVLPQRLYEEVEEAVREEGERPPALISGYPPVPEEG